MEQLWTLEEFAEEWENILEQSAFQYSDIIPVGKKREEGYGEIEFESFHNIILQTKLNEKRLLKGKEEESKWFLDFGSGIGNIVTFVAYTTPSICVGVEIQKNRSEYASMFSMLLDVRRRMNDFARETPISDQRSAYITLYTGDGLLMEPALNIFDVIFSNNLLFDESLLRKFFKMVGQSAASGTLLVVTKMIHDEEILKEYFTFPKERDLRIVKGVKSIPVESMGRSRVIQRTFAGFYLYASWTSKDVPYYITQKK
jgi:SAM-dependent methyltransferase